MKSKFGRVAVFVGLCLVTVVVLKLPFVQQVVELIASEITPSTASVVREGFAALNDDTRGFIILLFVYSCFELYVRRDEVTINRNAVDHAVNLLGQVEAVSSLRGLSAKALNDDAAADLADLIISDKVVYRDVDLDVRLTRGNADATFCMTRQPT